MPNALGPTIQVAGLHAAYLAGGIVVIEFVFNFPGIGTALVDAVGNRDLPCVQAHRAAHRRVYVAVNIATDTLTILATPRQRTAMR